MSSDFIKEAINKQLAALRYQCALERGILKNQTDAWWEPTEYWQSAKKKAIAETEERLKKADEALVAFIAEHRGAMGQEWVGNDHGRLCWDSFLGGLPISTHYCVCKEGHAGPHHDNIGAWENKTKPPVRSRSDQPEMTTSEKPQG